MDLSNLEKLLQLARTQVVLRYAERPAGSTGSLGLEVDIDAFIVEKNDFLHLYRLRRGSALWSMPNPGRLGYNGVCVAVPFTSPGHITGRAIEGLFEEDWYTGAWGSPKPFCGIRQPFNTEFALHDISLVGLMHLIRLQTMLIQFEPELAIKQRLWHLITDRLEHIGRIFSFH